MFTALLRNPRLCTSVVLRGTAFNHLVRVASTVPTTAEEPKSIEELLKEELPKPYDGPERDHVNYPHRKILVYPGKVRMGFAPEEWFEFFYKKTGVTGPYVFGVGLITFLLSKEWFVIEEEFSTLITLTLMSYFGIKKFGPKVAAYGDKLVEKRENHLIDGKEKNMKHLEDCIVQQKKNLWCFEGSTILLDAKRENIHMQLDAEYRKRLMKVYSEVKKRLDYQMDLVNTRRQMEQKHMANWIVDNVLKSITPQQEKDALQKCIADLKSMSAAR